MQKFINAVSLNATYFIYFPLGFQQNHRYTESGHSLPLNQTYLEAQTCGNRASGCEDELRMHTLQNVHPPPNRDVSRVTPDSLLVQCSCRNQKVPEGTLA